MTRWSTFFIMGCSLLLTSSPARAGGHQFGIKGGVAIQELGGDDVETDEIESRTGFVGGFFFQTDFSENFGLRVEGLYFNKGARADSADVELTVKLDYIEFPFLLMANLPFGEGGRLSVFGGPTLGFSANSEAELSIDTFSASVDVGEIVASTEFGLTFGAGLTFDVGPVVLGVDGRYGFGLTTVVEDDIDFDNDGVPDFGGEDFDVTNRGFAFMAQVGFPIGGSQ
jgi:opacity protein-like surface antigen